MENKLGQMYTEAFRSNWDLPLFNDYGNDTVYKYSDVAKSIQTISRIFDDLGIKKGSRIAIYGRNSTNWAKVFLACMAHGVVAVPILPDFIPENVEHIIEHSEATFLFAGTSLFGNLNQERLKNIKAAIAVDDFSVLKGDAKLANTIQSEMNSVQDESLSKNSFAFEQLNDEDVQVLSYTSGSSGFSKGVMIPVRSLYSNILFAREHMPLKSSDKIVSFLPMAHVFGMAFEFLFPVSRGCHLSFLTRTPSPQILLKAFAEVKPHLVFMVPLVIEKIYKKKLLPVIQKPIMKILLNVPGINGVLHKKIRNTLIESFGGRFYELVIGGAALSAEVETFLRKIRFPFTIGYGMTECGPLISYEAWDKAKLHSAGKLVDRMKIRIESEDPFNTVGEIQVNGSNIMLGYFKNEEANRNTFTEDGWLKTGDLGVIDKDKFVFIRGRSKNMLLDPSGQNIYPEELEARLTNMPYVQECVVVQRDQKLVALVFPEEELVKVANLDQASLEKAMADNRNQFNETVAAYEQLTKIELVKEEFEKTPKKNIKRYLYT